MVLCSLPPGRIKVLRAMNTNGTQNTKSTATNKVGLLVPVWDRFESIASTASPQDGDVHSICGESDGDDPSSPCQQQATTGFKDCRPCQHTLHRELACELHSQVDLHQEQVCPEAITSSSRDWRPTTVSLRRALHARLNVKKADATALIGPCLCPATITANTLDWRPLTQRLSNQLAAAKTHLNRDMFEEPKEPK